MGEPADPALSDESWEPSSVHAAILSRLRGKGEVAKGSAVAKSSKNADRGIPGLRRTPPPPPHAYESPPGRATRKRVRRITAAALERLSVPY